MYKQRIEVKQNLDSTCYFKSLAEETAEKKSKENKSMSPWVSCQKHPANPAFKIHLSGLQYHTGYRRKNNLG